MGYNPIEKQAPGILERQSVDTPLHTGILAIDSMFPIGRGQRELIIGDRQTGKTAIAVDTILNQKGPGCDLHLRGHRPEGLLGGPCAGHPAKARGPWNTPSLSRPPPAIPLLLQYIAPYAGAAMGEYFMEQGRDVLIVYDDLSKHAVAYRALSLLLKRSPGREAYPATCSTSTPACWSGPAA